MSEAGNSGARARHRAREFLVQALYQWQIAGHGAAELTKQYENTSGYGRADPVYFCSLLAAIVDAAEALTLKLQPYLDRDASQLDPIEKAVLLIGLFELIERRDVPRNVVINEAIELCKRYGAADAHKFVNAVLDKAAKDLR